MKSEVKNKFIISGIFGALFLLFTAEVKLIDVEPIGPLGSLVGFSSINKAFASLIKVSDFCYAVSDALGIFALFTVFFLAICGLLKVIKGKSIRAAGPELLILGAFYAAVFAVYIAFEFIKINYRPILMNGALEASYPSSHTVLSLCVFGSAALFSDLLPLPEKTKRPFTRKVFTALAVLSALARLFSGVHWLTDIMGGVFVSEALLFFLWGLKAEIPDRP